MSDNREYYQIAVPPGAPQWEMDLIASINATLERIGHDMAKMRGLDGLTPEFANAPDLNANRLKNIAQAVEDTDAIRKDQAATTDQLRTERLVKTDTQNRLASVTKLTEWIKGTIGRVIVRDVGNGTVTVTLPNTPSVAGIILTGLVANRLLYANATKAVASAVDLTDWIAGTAGRVTVTDDGDGTITITLPNDLSLTSLILTGLGITYISVRTAAYEWNLSAFGTNEYYLEVAGGGTAGITVQPNGVRANGTHMVLGTVSSLAAGEWGYGNVDGLSNDTIYVRLSDGTDPDTKAADYIEYNLHHLLGVGYTKQLATISRQAHEAYAVGVSGVSLGAGTDTVDATTFNSDLAAAISTINDAIATVNSIITKLETIGVFSL